jgi:hypothetical protein
MIIVDTDLLIRIGVFTLILIGAWVILKTFLRLASRLFFFGCGAILVLGVLLFILSLIQGH